MPVSISAGRKRSSGTGAGDDEGAGEDEGAGDDEGAAAAAAEAAEAAAAAAAAAAAEAAAAAGAGACAITDGGIDIGCLGGGRGRISTDDIDPAPRSLAVPGSARRNTTKASTATPTIIPSIKSIAPIDDDRSGAGAGADGSFGAKGSYAYGYIPGSIFWGGGGVVSPLNVFMYNISKKKVWALPMLDQTKKKFGMPITQNKYQAQEKKLKKRKKKKKERWSCVSSTSPNRTAVSA